MNLALKLMLLWLTAFIAALAMFILFPTLMAYMGYSVNAFPVILMVAAPIVLAYRLEKRMIATYRRRVQESKDQKPDG